jgi:hypothetical protein
MSQAPEWIGASPTTAENASHAASSYNADANTAPTTSWRCTAAVGAAALKAMQFGTTRSSELRASDYSWRESAHATATTEIVPTTTPKRKAISG